MRYFKSDNTAAVSPEILQAIVNANSGAAVPYGTDRWSERLNTVFGEFFGREVRVFAVSSGTAANSLALATLCPPWGTVLTHAEAHFSTSEIKIAVTVEETRIEDAARAVHDAFQLDKEPVK